MRWIFIALVLANIGVFFWHSVESSRLERLEALNASSGESQGVISGAPLVLLSELTEQEKVELMKAKEPLVAREPSIEVAPVAEAVANANDPTAESQADKNIKPAVSTSGASDEAVAPVVVPNQCSRIGPFLNAAQAEQVSQRLMALTIITESVDVDTPGKSEYWVILPPFNDEKIALMKLQELQGRAIKAQIISKGEMTNAISFGLHGQKDDANQQANELNAKGYKVQVKAVPVINREKWLALSERQSPKLTDAIWEDIHADFPGLNKQVRNCR